MYLSGLLLYIYTLIIIIKIIHNKNYLCSWLMCSSFNRYLMEMRRDETRRDENFLVSDTRLKSQSARRSKGTETKQAKLKPGSIKKPSSKMTRIYEKQQNGGWN